MANINDLWKKLAAENKRKIIIAAVIGLIVLISLSVSNSRGKKPKSNEKAVTTNEISLDPKMAQNTIYEETRRKSAEMEREQEDMKRTIKELQKSKEDQQKMIDVLEKRRGPEDAKTPRTRDNNTAGVPASFPLPQGSPDGKHNAPSGLMSMNVPPPPVPAGMPSPGNTSGIPQVGSQQSYQVIGDITVVSGKQETSGTQGKKGEGDKGGKDGKDDKKKYYLPPCFVKASLLSGVRAPTMGDAKKDPVPLIFRTKAPAQLPNYVKSNIQACFVIAEGAAKLSDERVHARLVTLSCLSKDGHSVIDQKISGFAVDEDGVVGLSGIVTARFGSMIARSFLAGMLQGAGDAVKASTTTVSTTPLGESQIISSSDWNNIAKAGVGGGLSTASKELQEFFMSFAKEATPVLEVGGSKPCTLVISQGTYLEVKTEEVMK